jgi:hypothetical protein
MTTQMKTEAPRPVAVQAGICQCTKCGPDCACETCTCENCECSTCNHQK